MTASHVGTDEGLWLPPPAAIIFQKFLYREWEVSRSLPQPFWNFDWLDLEGATVAAMSQ